MAMSCGPLRCLMQMVKIMRESFGAMSKQLITNNQEHFIKSEAITLTTLVTEESFTLINEEVYEKQIYLGKYNSPSNWRKIPDSEVPVEEGENKMLDWNKERKRTRDRLLDYDFSIVPAYPHSAGLPMVYPWENITLSQLSHQFFTLAQKNGYEGSEEELWKRFYHHSVVYGTLDSFPIPGEENTLYLDIETEILYYYKNISGEIDAAKIAVVGGAIVGYSEILDVTYVYIPIRA